MSSATDSSVTQTRLATDAGVQVVVIDAGHGGRDLGCRGGTHGAREKEIALELAIGLRDQLERAHPDMQVVLTRERDVFVPLHKRARIANRAQADLFISLHCNALPNTPGVRGSESYVMGLHTAQHNLDVAKRENAAIHLEADGAAAEHYDFDPDSPAGHITLSMFQHAHLEQSMALASDIEFALGARDGHRSRGVKQAGFLVLKETAMPSVLIETGYLTNPTEEAYLKSGDGQSETIASLYDGVASYLRERRRARREAIPVQVAIHTPQRIVPVPGARPTEAQERLAAISEPGQPIEAHLASAPATVPASPPAPVAKPAVAHQFYVQLSASAKTLSTGGGKWTSLGHPIREVYEGGYYKYQAGPFTDLGAAEAAKRAGRGGSFPDAFVVGYREGEKLTRGALEGLR